jgi:t-SNARE complex subunit (syntaxin)
MGTPQKIVFYKILFFVLCMVMFVVFSDVIDLLFSL